MNLWQALQQVRYLLRQQTWADSPGELIFPSDSVIISNGPIRESLLARISYPAAIVADAGSRSHDEHPTVKNQTISITILHRHLASPWGESALIGANRDTTVGSSLHRGLLEVTPVAIEDLARAGREVGLSVYLAGETDAAPVQISEELTLLAKEFRLACMVNDVEAGEYPPVSGLALASFGGGVAVSWTAPAARYDLLSGAASVVRKASSAPSSLGDGTLIADGTTGASVTDTPGSGTWYYGVSAKFDEGLGTRLSDVLRTDSIVLP